MKLPGNWTNTIGEIRKYLEIHNPGLRNEFDALVEDHFMERPWSEILADIRGKMEAGDSDLIWRFDELAELRGSLLDYVEAIEASLLGFDPDDEYGEAAFGDVGMLRTIQLLCTLHTIPARIEDIMGEERAAAWRAEQEEWRSQGAKDVTE